MDYVLSVIFKYGWVKAIDNESVLRKSGRYIFDGWQRWQ